MIKCGTVFKELNEEIRANPQACLDTYEREKGQYSQSAGDLEFQPLPDGAL